MQAPPLSRPVNILISMLPGGVATLVSLTIRDFVGEKVHSMTANPYFFPIF